MTQELSRRKVLSGISSGALVSISSETVGAINPSDGVEQKWVQSLKDEGVSPPTIGDGTVFVGVDSRLMKLGGRGRIIWNADLDTGLISNKPTLHRDDIFVSSYTGVGAIHRGTGEVVWRTETGDGGHSTPAVSDESVYVTRGRNDHHDEKAKVLSLEGKDGSIEWTNELKGNSWSSPAIGDAVYVGDTSGRLYAFDPLTGDEVWTCHLGQPITGSALVDDSKIYVAGQDEKMFCVSETGNVLWSGQAGQPIAGTKPVQSKGLVYLGHRKGVHAFDPESGNRIWKDRTEGTATSPSVQGKSVIYGLSTGVAVSADRRTGDRQWEVEFPGFRRLDMVFKGIRRTPSSGNGKVYIMVDGGRLYKIGDQ